METTKIPLAACVESRHQNRRELGDVSGLARSIEVNGQITPLIVVADGEAYQLVAGHRRTAAMRSLGLEVADAYVMDGWDDARIASVLNAENNHRRELTEAERGRGIQTMLSLGVPVADAAVSADIPEEMGESYVRGAKVVPVDAVNLDFDAVALMGDYDDVLTENDVVAVLSKRSHWDRQAVCRRARARKAAEDEAARLESLGVKVVERKSLGEGYHACDGECGHAGLVAAVKPCEWGERADVTFDRDDGARRIPAHARGGRGDRGLPQAPRGRGRDARAHHRVRQGGLPEVPLKRPVEAAPVGLRSVRGGLRMRARRRLGGIQAAEGQGPRPVHPDARRPRVPPGTCPSSPSRRATSRGPATWTTSSGSSPSWTTCSCPPATSSPRASAT